jgi:radical SAM protein with 4Fe4S-binding SPASM domain
VGLRWFDRGKENHFMSMDIFDRIAAEARGFVRHTYLHLWGEPTLNKDLPEMIRKTKEFSTVDLATHGLFIDEEMAEAVSQCDTVSVSMDGIDQETYEKYRVGGQLEKAMNGLRLLIKTCGHKVNWTFVVFKDNEHQLAAAQQLADEIGANIGFKPPLFWDKGKMDANMPTDEKHRRYVRVNGEWQLKADRLKCREFWETIYILPSGDVITCCYDGAAEFVVGNVKESSILDVWNGKPYTAMREKHSAGQLNKMCLQYCQLPN